MKLVIFPPGLSDYTVQAVGQETAMYKEHCMCITTSNALSKGWQKHLRKHIMKSNNVYITIVLFKDMRAVSLSNYTVSLIGNKPALTQPYHYKCYTKAAQYIA